MIQVLQHHAQSVVYSCKLHGFGEQLYMHAVTQGPGHSCTPGSDHFPSARPTCSGPSKSRRIHAVFQAACNLGDEGSMEHRCGKWMDPPGGPANLLPAVRISDDPVAAGAQPALRLKPGLDGDKVSPAVVPQQWCQPRKTVLALSAPSWKGVVRLMAGNRAGHRSSAHHLGYVSICICILVAAKIRFCSTMTGSAAKPVSVRPQTTTAWLPATSCARSPSVRA